MTDFLASEYLYVQRNYQIPWNNDRDEVGREGSNNDSDDQRRVIAQSHSFSASNSECRLYKERLVIISRNLSRAMENTMDARIGYN